MLYIREKLLPILKSKLKFIEDEQNFNWDTNLKELGLDSMSTINLLLSIEDEFQVVFPETLTNESTFSTGETLYSALQEIVSIQ